MYVCVCVRLFMCIYMHTGTYTDQETLQPTRTHLMLSGQISLQVL